MTNDQIPMTNEPVSGPGGEPSLRVLFEVLKGGVKVGCDPEDFVFGGARLAGPGGALAADQPGKWLSLLGDEHFLTRRESRDQFAQLRLGLLQRDGGHRSDG